ncbi:MAG TPA: hypothetical protein PLO37_14540 [Candidatus Hydrogenedentes bacterium]|nr:hypothetical protein [Candidatus Hydrogenedentota bacterium]HPG68065.1 hypothetical protein [Candidatus Hydrogenedentota bacterium]
MRLTPFLFLAIVLAASAGSAESYWTPEPPPSGECSVDPEMVTLDQNVCFGVLSLDDKDTHTTITPSGKCVNISQAMEDDVVGGTWRISQAGCATVDEDVTAKCVTAEAWDWDPDEGTGAEEEISGTFTFDDKRDAEDARHDTSGCSLGGGLCVKLIPDHVETIAAFMCPGEYPEHHGSVFLMLCNNDAHPEFSFEGLTIKEEITSIQCAIHDEIVDAAIKLVIGQATTTWTLNANGCFHDWHVVGPGITTIFDRGNQLAKLIQVYVITSTGWSSRNPSHTIGRTPGIFGGLSALHLVEFTHEAQGFWRVVKDGRTCDHTP